MKTYLEESFSMIKLKAELEDNNSEFYFAELNNNIIGYLKLNWGKSQTEIQDGNTLEIERIYVLKHFYGKNIGQLLFQKAKDIAI
jgi:GNAT superfamily N-acetyltransferase